MNEKLLRLIAASLALPAVEARIHEVQESRNLAEALQPLRERKKQLLNIILTERI